MLYYTGGEGGKI